MAAAAAALIDRVDPNCRICTSRSEAAIASDVSPGPSCPKSRTHAAGSGHRAFGDVGGVAIDDFEFAFAQAMGLGDIAHGIARPRADAAS